MPEKSMEVVVVTGASSNHFPSLLQFLRELKKAEDAAKSLRVVTIAYDLGLTPHEHGTVASQFSHVVLRRFDYSKHPEWFDINREAGAYAWKPCLFRDVVSEHRGPLVIWNDAGNIITNLELLAQTVSRASVYTPYSCDRIDVWAHPKTMEYMGVTPEERPLKNRNAAVVGINSGVEYARDLVDSWARLASVKECIAPDGSSRDNHRQDQSLLTVLYYRSLRAHSFRDFTEYAGFTVHNDV